jgi:hypothetical protein
MIQPARTNGQRRYVTCPDCGRMYASVGLARHRSSHKRLAALGVVLAAERAADIAERARAAASIAPMRLGVERVESARAVSAAPTAFRVLPPLVVPRPPRHRLWRIGAESIHDD